MCSENKFTSLLYDISLCRTVHFFLKVYQVKTWYSHNETDHFKSDNFLLAPSHIKTCKRPTVLFTNGIKWMKFKWVIRALFRPGIDMLLGRSDHKWTALTRQFTPGIRMRLNMSLEWPLVIESHFSALYANKHVVNTWLIQQTMQRNITGMSVVISYIFMNLGTLCAADTAPLPGDVQSLLRVNLYIERGSENTF